MRTSTRGLCEPASELIPFRKGLQRLRIPLRTAERLLRRRDPRLPPVLYADGRRFFREDDLRATEALRVITGADPAAALETAFAVALSRQIAIHTHL